MPDIKISQLANLTFLDSSDVIIINDASSGTTKQASLTTLLDLVGARLVSDSSGGVSVTGDLTVDNEIIAGGDITAETGTIGFGSLKDITQNITITKFITEADGIANNNDDTSIPTSAAVRAYADVSGGATIAGTLLVDSATDSDRNLYPVLVGVLSSTDSARVDSDFRWNPFDQIFSMGGNIVPREDSVYDLGTATLKWRDLYLSGNTINMGPSGSSIELKKSGNNLVIAADAVQATAFIGDGAGLTGLGIPDAPRIVQLTPDTQQIIRYDSDGVTETDTLSFTATTENFTGVQSYDFLVDGVVKSTISVDAPTASFTLQDADEPAYDTNKLIRVDAKEGGVTKATDYVSVYGIKASIDGQTVVTGFLTNEVHAEAADSTGELTGNLNDAGGTFKVFAGLTDITGDGALTYSITNSPGISLTLASSGEYAVTSFDSLLTQSGTASLSVTIPDSLIPGYSGSDVTIDKTYSIVKQIGGSGIDGAAGSNARAVKVVPLNGQVVRYDSANQEFDTLQFDAIPEGTTGAVTYQWAIKHSTEAVGAYGTDTRGITQPLQDGAATAFTLADGQEPNFGATVDDAPVRTLRCTMFEDAVEVASDVVTLYAVKSGYAVTGYLTNGSHVEPCDSAGAPVVGGTLDDGDGTFKVLIGTQEVQTDAGVTFSTVSNTGINIGLDANGEYTLNSFSADNLTVLSGQAVLRATVSNSLLPDGENDVIIDQTYSVAKSIRGPKGLEGSGVGDAGADARAITLNPDNGQAVRFNDAGTEDPAVVMSFTADVENTVGTVTYQFFTKLIGAGGGYVAATGIQSGNTFTLDGSTYDGNANVRNKPEIGQSIAVRVELREENRTGVQATDTVTVYGLANGTTITGFLTNESHVEPYDESGNLKDGSFSTAGGTFKIFRGTTDITTLCSFSVDAETGVDVEIGAATGIYTVASLTADVASATFQASIPAAQIPGAGSALLYDKTYSISKTTDGTTPETPLPGVSPIVADLSNENHSITADKDGNALTPKVASSYSGSTYFTGASTILSIYEGITDVTSLYSITTAPASAGAITYNTGADGAAIEITGMGATNGSQTITFTGTRSGYPDVTAVFTITKVNAGQNGVGVDATVYSLSTSASVIGSNPARTSFTPTTLISTALKYVGSAAPVKATTGTFMTVEQIGGTAGSGSAADGDLSFLLGSAATSMVVKLYLGTDATGTLVDQETIPVIAENTAGVGTRGPGRWTDSYNANVALPTTNTTIQNAWDATGIYTAASDVGATAGAPVSGDQFILTRNTTGGAFVGQKAYIYSTVWTEQAEFIDGSLLVAGTVTADSFATSGVVGTSVAVGKTIIKDSGVEVQSWNGAGYTTRVKLGDLS